VPAQQRLRCHDHPPPASRWEEPRKRSEESAIGCAERRARLLPLEHRQLVPQNNQLDVLGELAAPASAEQLQYSRRTRGKRTKGASADALRTRHIKGEASFETPQGEVGHWEILGTLNERARNSDISELVGWALPIQQQHFETVRATSLKLAAEENPNEQAE
jgi:hypothetical protein